MLNHDKCRCVVDDGQRTWYSPTGVPLAVFQDYMGGEKEYVPLYDGLEFEGDFASEDDAVKHMIRQYELLTTTRGERFARSVSGVFKHGAWGAIAAAAAILAAVLGLLTYLNTLPTTP